MQIRYEMVIHQSFLIPGHLSCLFWNWDHVNTSAVLQPDLAMGEQVMSHGDLNIIDQAHTISKLIARRFGSGNYIVWDYVSALGFGLRLTKRC